jgi:hypothetical protein
VIVTVNRLVFRGTALQLVLMLAITAHSQWSVAADRAHMGELPALNWQTLEFLDSGLTGSLTTRIELRRFTAAELQPALLHAPDIKSPRQADNRILELAVANSIRLLLGAGVESQSRLWFNEGDGLPLQLMRVRRGSKPSQKLYRFGSRRVYRQRRQPADRAETKQPAEHWSEVSESYYPLPDEEAECPVILESSQLLYLLSRPDTVPGDGTEALCVFDRQRVYRVDFRVLGQEPLAVNYLQVESGEETRVKRTLEALHVILTGRPLEGAPADGQPFSFLGLQGDIQLLLSDPGRIPLRIHGEVPGFGRIDLELGVLTR